MAQENPSGANPLDARPRSLKTRTSTRSVFPEHHRCPEVPPDRLRGGRPRLRERDPVQKHGHQVRLLPCGAGPAAAGGGSEEHQAGPEDPGHHAAGTSGAHGESSRERGAQQDRVSWPGNCLVMLMSSREAVMWDRLRASAAPAQDPHGGSQL